jgi:hypothetical protein
MIIFNANPLLLPVLVCIWLMDGWIFLCIIRAAITYCITGNGTPRLHKGLERYTDIVPDAIERILAKMSITNKPRWLLWTISCIAVWMIRAVMTALIMPKHM